MQSKFSMKIEAFGYIERNTLLGRRVPAAQQYSVYKVQLNLAGVGDESIKVSTRQKAKDSPRNQGSRHIRESKSECHAMLKKGSY